MPGDENRDTGLFRNKAAYLAIGMDTADNAHPGDLTP
jgi:hypothetical protein